MSTAQIPHHCRVKAAKDSVHEAHENHMYWRRQAAVRTDPEAKAKAGALAKAWETTRKARQSSLDNLLFIRTKASIR